MRQRKAGLNGLVGKKVDGKITASNILISAVGKSAFKTPFPAMVQFQNICVRQFILVLSIAHVKIVIKELDARQNNILRDDSFSGFIVHFINSTVVFARCFLNFLVKKIR